MYIPNLTRLAKQLESYVVIDYKESTAKYKVSIFETMYRDKNSFLRLSVEGYGITLEDAAYDYIRKSRGGYLVNTKTNEEIEPL